MEHQAHTPTRRVLVVEDDDFNALFATRLLERLGCEVVCADNGQRAVELLDEAPFDAVLMDVQMQGMDGLEATRRIRSRERERGRRRVPICALSAHAPDASEPDCLAAGMDAYQRKPFDSSALRALLDRLLETPPAPSSEELCKRFGGDPSVVTEVAALFLERSPVLVDKVEATVEEGAPSSIERAAHTLKGTLLTMGAACAASSAEAIESAARAHAPTAHLLAPLRREIERLRAHLEPMARAGDTP